MQNDRRLAARIAAGPPVDAIAVANLEHAVFVWFDRWIQMCHRTFSLRDSGRS